MYKLSRRQFKISFPDTIIERKQRPVDGKPLTYFLFTIIKPDGISMCVSKCTSANTFRFLSRLAAVKPGEYCRGIFTANVYCFTYELYIGIITPLSGKVERSDRIRGMATLHTETYTRYFREPHRSTLCRIVFIILNYVLCACVCVYFAGKPRPWVKWFRNEIEIEGKLDPVQESEGASHVRSEIVIEDLGRKDVHSELTCQAGNNNKSTPLSSTLHLDMNCKCC